MKTAISTLIISLFASVFALGQGTTAPSTSSPTLDAVPIPTKFWKAALPGGNYMVALGRISSIAQHTYVVDGAARVYEVTIADSSSAIARFYFLEAVTEKSPLSVGQVVIDRAKDVTKRATERAGANDVWNQVVKNYPTTTHARTMEFRLTAKSNIDSIYASVSRAWERGKGERISVKSE